MIQQIHAGFWKRFGASVIDGIVLYIAFWIFLYGSIAIVAILDVDIFPSNSIIFGNINHIEGETAQTFVLILRVILFTFVPRWVYFSLFECSKMRATPGKRVLGLIVLDEKHQRISFGRASIRYWSSLLSTLLLYGGYIMAGYTKHKQALHDKIARTYVIDEHRLLYEQLILEKEQMLKAERLARAQSEADVTSS